MSKMLKLAEAKANPEVIELLEMMLEKARSGELVAVTAIASTLGGDVEAGSAGEWTASLVFYAVECWKHRQLHAQQHEE